MPGYGPYISKITLPNGNTYDIKDAEARELITEIVASGVSFVRSTNAANTPLGVTWIDNSQTPAVTITGTLQPVDSTTQKPLVSFYLVPANHSETHDTYAEYKVVNIGSEQVPNYVWEKLGDTEVDFDDLGDLAWHDNVVFTKYDDNVLGEATTFTNSTSAVTFSGDSSDTFVKSYPGSTQKLATTSIKGVGSDTTFTAISTATDDIATKTVFGTATSASAVTTVAKEATKLVLGTDETVNKVSSGAAKTFALRDSAATNVSRITLSSGNTDILETATVTSGTETLVIGAAAVTQSSVTGTSGTDTITPITIGAAVTVPQVTSNDSVTFDAVSTNTSVTVPVVTSNDEVTMTKITTTSVTAATSAANATTVATGKVAASDSNGDDVLVGLGTAVTASAVTDIGTGTAAAQTITVGTNDIVDALTNSSTVTVTDNVNP